MGQYQPTMSTGALQLSSFGTRMMNVFSSPGELFSEVAALPVQKSSWVIPYLLSIILVVVFTYALYSNESLRQQIFGMQLQGMQEAVVEGRMSQAQLDQFEDRMRGSGLGMFMIFGSVPQIVVISIMFFGMALFLWLAAKIVLKANAGYAKLLESSGLATLIGFLGAIVTLLLMYALDSLHASPSTALAILGSYEAKNKLHAVLSSLNIFTLWETAVVGIALSKISGKSTGTSMGVAFGLWAIWTAIAVALGIGFR